MTYDQWQKREDKRRRARAALELYVDDAGLARPRPDQEEDDMLNKILDRLAWDVVDLASWFSESVAWMMWAQQREPPLWVYSLLTEEEIAGLGPKPTGEKLPNRGPKPEEEPTDQEADDAQEKPAAKKKAAAKKKTATQKKAEEDAPGDQKKAGAKQGKGGKKSATETKKRQRHKKKHIRYPTLWPEDLEFMVDHYDSLPTIDHTTGRPAGELR